MTTNEELKNLMESHGLDIRADKRSNRDVAYVAKLLDVSDARVAGWLAPEHWKTHRKMHAVFLTALKNKLEK